jgi:hypothetical protein
MFRFDLHDYTICHIRISANRQKRPMATVRYDMPPDIPQSRADNVRAVLELRRAVPIAHTPTARLFSLASGAAGGGAGGFSVSGLSPLLAPAR